MSTDVTQSAGDDVGSVVIDPDAQVVTGTPVGVDIGLHQLLVVAPASAGADLDAARAFHTDGLRQRYAELRDRHDDPDGVRGDPIADWLHGRVDGLAEEAVAYARAFELPLLAIEKLPHPAWSLTECVVDDAELPCWAFQAVQSRLVEHASEAGMPVVATNAKYTTQQCHACGQFAHVEDETIRCTTDECPVGRACRDRSAAVTIAKRV